MSIFGWSYPPGAASDPWAPYNMEEGPCEVCGSPVDDCICPECPTCGCMGNPACYGEATMNDHGLKRTIDQWHGMALLEEADRQQAAADKAEYEYWTDPQRKVEEAQFQELMRQERSK